MRKVGDLHRYDCLRANKATMAHGLEARVPFLDKDMLDATMFLDPEFKMYRKGAETQFIEKWALRAAFDTEDNPYLPKEVLWRQKEQVRRQLLWAATFSHRLNYRSVIDLPSTSHRPPIDLPRPPKSERLVSPRISRQFSDGVGYSWIDGLKEHAERVISDEDMRTAPLRFSYNTPATKEGAYYRTIFHSHFPNNNYGNGIEETVPGGPSIACSTAKAIEWDEAWSDPTKQDNSGRMVDTHESAV